MKPPRYSRQSFPAYRFIPGQTPHPTRDPEGHSYNTGNHALPEHFEPGSWYENEAYLYGVDLYNHGYWWEAHEAWEGCWIAAGKQTETGLFLQGLIQITAGCLKKFQGHIEAGRGLAFDGMDKFPSWKDRLLGIELQPFKEALKEFFTGNLEEQPLIELTFPRDNQKQQH